MRKRKTGLLAGLLAFAVIGQTMTIPVQAETGDTGAVMTEESAAADSEENSASSGSEEETAAADGGSYEAVPADTASDDGKDNTEESKEAATEGDTENAAAEGSTLPEETETAAEGESDAHSKTTPADAGIASVKDGYDAEAALAELLAIAKEKKSSGEEDADSSDGSEDGDGGAGDLYVGVLESGEKFISDLKTLGTLRSIENITWSDTEPTGEYVELGDRHRHTDDCYHTHDDSCYTTAEITRGYAKAAESSAYTENGEEVLCSCGSGLVAVQYTADISETKKIDGELLQEETLTGQEAVACASCVDAKYGIGTHTASGLTCGLTEKDRDCGFETGERKTHILAWESDGTLYLYNQTSPGAGVYLNADCAGMFASMTKLKSLDLSKFDGSLVTDTTNMFPSSLTCITLNASFRFSETKGTPGSGLAGAWEKDGIVISDGDTTTPFITQKEYNTTLLTGTFEDRWNNHAAEYAGTWVRNDESHSYYARGQATATAGGNIYEEHSPDKRFYGYCFAQHLESPHGKYDKVLVDDEAIIEEILKGQKYQTEPAADNIRDAIITILYYGFPNDKAGLQDKYGLTDKRFSIITWDVLCHYSDGIAREGKFSGKEALAYNELYNMTYDSIPQSLKENLHLYIFISEEHCQHLVAIDGVTYEDLGGVSVLKEDAGTEEPLSGAVFTIYDENGDPVDADKSTAEIDPIVSDSTGTASICRCDETEGLPMGTYTIRETKAPAGYAAANYSYTFTVSQNGCISRTGTNSRTGAVERMIFRDQSLADRRAGGIRVRKVDAESTDVGILGAVYGIYTVDPIVSMTASGEELTLYEKDELVMKVTTGEDGYAETGTSDLPLGDYYLKEITPPAGYIRNEETVPFTVSEENVLQTETITLRDEPKKVDAELCFHKEILPEGRTLRKGQFTFELYREVFPEEGAEATRTLVGETTNEADGSIVFNSGNTNGALSFTATTDLGQANFICVEKIPDDTRYICDAHEEIVEITLEDDGETDHLIASPSYGADSDDLKKNSLYATDELIKQNYKPGYFRNEFKGPAELKEPSKEVSGGKTITAKLHNEVKCGESFTYDVLQSIPAEAAADRFESFGFYDELPAGIALGTDDSGAYDVRVFADGTDVTDDFRIRVKTRETDKETQYIVSAAYSKDLTAEAAYGVTYDVRLGVSAGETAEKTTFTNFARVDITYADKENHYIYDESGETVKDDEGNVLYEAETPYRLAENSERAAGTTTEPGKAVHSVLTNAVETDVIPAIAEDGFAVEKQVYNSRGEAINTCAVQHEDTLTYKIAIRNKMEKITAAAVIEDALPEHVSFVDADPEAVYNADNGTLCWKNLTVKPGETVTVSCRVHVEDGAAFAAIDNIAHASLCPACFAGGDDASQYTVCRDTETMHNYVPQITKMVTDSDGKNVNGILVPDGTELIYHIYVTNPDTSGEDPSRTGAHTFTITDAIPENTEYTEDPAKKTLTWTADLAPGETKEFSFKVKTDGKGVMIRNTANMTVINTPAEESSEAEKLLPQQVSPGTSSYSSNEVVNGTPLDPVKTVTTTEGKDVDGQFLTVGKSYRYSITVDNPAKEAKTYTITDKVPEYIEVDEIEGASRVITTAKDPGTVSYIDGTLTYVVKVPSEEKTTVSYTFHPTGKGAHITNTAHTALSGNIPTEPLTGMKDSAGTDHTLEQDTNEVENWTLADPVKTVVRASGSGKDADGALLFGENKDRLTYTIQFTNTADRKGTFTITDTLDKDLRFDSATDDGRYDSDTQTVIWTKELDAGQTGSVSVTARVSCGNKDAAAENTAAVYIDDANVKTNTTTTCISASPVKKVFDTDGSNIDDFLVKEGERLVYSIEVHNPAKETKRFRITDSVPDGTEFISADKGESTSLSAVYDSTAMNTVSVSGAETKVTWETDIPAGETYRFTFRVKAAKKGAYLPNDALVTVDDSRIRTNLVENWTPEDPMKAVTKNGKDASGATFTIGEETELTYTIAVSNPANIAKTFTVTDTLDSNLKFVSADHGGTLQNRTVTWSVKVGAGEEEKVSVSVKILAQPYGTKIDNIAAVRCDLFDAETNKVTVYLKKAPEDTSSDSTGSGTTVTSVTTNGTKESASLAYRNPGTVNTGDNGTVILAEGIASCCGAALLLLLYLRKMILKKKERKQG